MNQNYVLFNQEQEDSLFIPSGRHKGLNKNTKIKKSTKFNSSLWTFTENQKYVQFLIQQQSTMQNVQERKQSKVFVRMSQFIKGRSPEQCRSHHQKIIKYYHSVQNIISNLMKVKEKQLIKKAKQLQETQKTMPMQFLSNQAQIQQKQSVTISLISTFTPEPQILQSQDMWDMIDQKMWIR